MLRSNHVSSFESLESRRLFAGISFHVFPAVAHNTNFLQNLVAGPDGNVYFSSGLANNVASISPSGGVKVYDTTSVSPHGPSGLTLGPDGNIWFDELFANAIGEVNITTGKVTAIQNASGSLTAPVTLTMGPDKNIWTNSFDGEIQKVNATTGAIATYKYSGSGSGQIISFNGQLYFASGTQIDRVTIGGVFGTPIKMPSGGTVQGLTVGPDGNLWFTEGANGGSSDFFGYVTKSNTVKEFPIATTYGSVMGIAAPADGNIYFRDGTNLIGVNTAGKIIATQDLGSGSDTSSKEVIAGPDGNLWFNEGFNDQIGVAYVAGAISGKVTNSADGTGIAGVKVFIDTKNTGTFVSTDPSVLTGTSGAYRFNEPAGKYVVRIVVPSGDKAISATSATVTVSINKTATANFSLAVTTGAPEIGVVAADPSAAEGIYGSPATSGLILINREAGGTGAVTVDLTLGGTAVYNSDYKIAVFGGTFTYTATTKTVKVTLAANAAGAAIEIIPLVVTKHEPAETVSLTLQSNSLYKEDPTKLVGTVTIASH
jgi:streptogramin lyase